MAPSSSQRSKLAKNPTLWQTRRHIHYSKIWWPHIISHLKCGIPVPSLTKSVIPYFPNGGSGLFWIGSRHIDSRLPIFYNPRLQQPRQMTYFIYWSPLRQGFWPPALSVASRGPCINFEMSLIVIISEFSSASWTMFTKLPDLPHQISVLIELRETTGQPLLSVLEFRIDLLNNLDFADAPQRPRYINITSRATATWLGWKPFDHTIFPWGGAGHR